jgi:hypothetical protein
MAESPASTLSTDQVTELLGLLRRVDSVELKFTVPDTDRRSAVAALGIDPLDAQSRQVVYFDTPDLQLNQRGVVVRVRRVQGKPGDSVVKLRPVVPDELSALVRNSQNFTVEVDAMPGGFGCSGTMKAKLDPASVKETLAGRHPLRKLFSGEQHDLYANHAPFGLGLQELEMLGPINVLKLKFTPGDFDRPFVVEQWNSPTDHACSSCRRSVRPVRPLRSRPRPTRSSPGTGWT